MPATSVQALLDHKQQIDQLFRVVNRNTNLFFDISKVAFKEFFNESSAVTFNEGSTHITAKISDTSITLHKVEGVSLLKDEDFVGEETRKELSFQSMHQIVSNNDFRNFITGMLVFSVKHGVDKDIENVVISRIFVNEGQQAKFKNVLGWKAMDRVGTLSGFKEVIASWIYTSVNNGLFEIKSYWDIKKVSFDRASELNSSTGKIGFN